MGARERPKARSEIAELARLAGGAGKGDQANARGGGSSIRLRSQDETATVDPDRIWQAAGEVQGLKALVDLGIGLVAEEAVIGEATSRGATYLGSIAVGRNQNRRSESSGPRRLSVEYFSNRPRCHLCHVISKQLHGRQRLGEIRRRGISGMGQPLPERLTLTGSERPVCCDGWL